MWDLIVSVPDHCLSFYFTYPFYIMLESKYFFLFFSLPFIAECRADANINSLRFRRREFIFRNMPSSTMR